MTLTLPKSLEDRLTPHSTAIHLAVGLFVSEETTLAQAAQVAGMSQTEFLCELGKHRVPIHYGVEELAGDLEAVDFLMTP